MGYASIDEDINTSAQAVAIESCTLAACQLYSRQSSRSAHHTAPSTKQYKCSLMDAQSKKRTGPARTTAFPLHGTPAEQRNA